jgi:Family of unknown function (DUF5995)
VAGRDHAFGHNRAGRGGRPWAPERGLGILLRCMRRWRPAGRGLRDPRVPPLAVARITVSVACSALQGGRSSPCQRLSHGASTDPVTMTHLDPVFANLYFAAADAWEPSAAPAAWHPLRHKHLIDQLHKRSGNNGCRSDL